MSLKNDLRQLVKPYYLINILISLSYIIAKRLPVVCSYIFGDENCELDGRETEILFFLLIIVMIRTRKAGSVTMINYLSSSFIYTKVANMILWFYADVRMGILFSIIFVLVALLLPEPTYSGPENVTYFRGPTGLDDELARDKHVTWLVTFYTVWNPACINFAPFFAKISSQYNLDNLKFGKVDIGRFPEAGRTYKVSDSSMSKQLPTVVLFKDGKEVYRQPTVDSKGKVQKFTFSEENVIASFNLNNIYKESQENLVKMKAIKGHSKKE